MIKAESMSPLNNLSKCKAGEREVGTVAGLRQAVAMTEVKMPAGELYC